MHLLTMYCKYKLYNSVPIVLVNIDYMLIEL